MIFRENFSGYQQVVVHARFIFHFRTAESISDSHPTCEGLGMTWTGGEGEILGNGRYRCAKESVLPVVTCNFIKVHIIKV